MSVQIAVAFLLFATSMSITPGAGNLALLGISNRFGFAAALPFIAGTSFGVLIVFSGLISLLTANPELYTALKYLGAAYLLYIAWGISQHSVAEQDRVEHSAGFGAGALIQVLNPKAWIAAMTVFSQFTDVSGNYLLQVSVIIVAFLVVTTLCTMVWAYFGAALKRLLKSSSQMLIVNRCLGLTLAATVVFMLSQGH